MSKSAAIIYTQAQLEFIESNCVLGRKELTEKVNRKFGTSFAVDHIKSLCTRKNGIQVEPVILKKEVFRLIKGPKV